VTQLDKSQKKQFIKQFTSELDSLIDQLVDSGLSDVEIDIKLTQLFNEEEFLK
jgi:hypothetical protein